LNHWIILPVVLPAVLAPLMVLGMRHDLLLKRVFSVAGVLALIGVAVVLLVQASSGGPQVYLLGNWSAPFGIVLVLDRLSAMMVALTAILALVVVIYAIGTDWDARGRNFHALFQFQLMGICGAFLTGDAFNLFVFFEILLIASYGLMIHGGGKDRLRSGVQYVVYNLAGSTLFLFALATIYSVTGTLNMADLAVKVANLPEGDDALLRVAGVLLIMVFAVKGALVPFQFWLPGTYAHAPGPVSALFAVMTKIGAYAILRFYTLIFGPQVEATGTFFADLLLPAALITLVVGMVGVLGARGLGRFTPQTTAAALYYTLHSTFAGALMFLVADMVLERRGTGDLTAARPRIAQQGLIAALFFAAAIAMAGMPPLSGFVGKLLVMDAVRAHPWMPLIWGTILVTSLICIVGMGRAGSTLFWKSHATNAEPAASNPYPLGVVAAFGALALVVVQTVAAGPVMAWMEATAAQVHDTGAYIDAVLGLEGS
jgi:multicomponent K+:H+ antiporter subunit D